MLSHTTPILRSFDETKAREFYVDFMGFTVDWEHRFADHAPLYMQVSRGRAVLHISEHYGDASPGGAVRIETADVDALARELREKRYKFANPGDGQVMPWGTKEVTLTDPFKNRLIFFEQTPAGAARDPRKRRRYMIVECFRDAAAVYRRAREQGRLIPDGLHFVSSWVTDDLGRCFQVMECHDEQLLREWMNNWEDLVDFEVVPVVSSEEAAAKIDQQSP
jgi:uncharacterized glyoxalase superfamily protein PhnB